VERVQEDVCGLLALVALLEFAGGGLWAEQDGFVGFDVVVGAVSVDGVCSSLPAREFWVGEVWSGSEERGELGGQDGLRERRRRGGFPLGPAMAGGLSFVLVEDFVFVRERGVDGWHVGLGAAHVS
jgi:hypothetical protein